MALSAYFGVLADAIDAIGNFVDVFIGVYILLILVHIVLSWFQLPYRVWLYRIRQFLADVCEPYLRLFRRLLPSTGAIDLSPMLALIALIVIDRFLIWLLDHFH